MYADVADHLSEYRASGVLPDADFTVFYADHGLRPKAALNEAFAAYRNRPTAKMADALAWMLHSVGRDREAWSYATEVFGSSGEVPSTLFHAGMIARALDRGSNAAALMHRAMQLDPTFSVVNAPIARRIDKGARREKIAEALGADLIGR